MKAIKRIFCVMAVLLVLLLTGTGCSDKPENKSAKALRKSTDKAIKQAKEGLYLDSTDEADAGGGTDALDEAIDELGSAISKNRDGAGAVSSATLTKGDLVFTKSQRKHALLVDYSLPVAEIANDLVSENNRLIELNKQKGSLQAIIDVNDERVEKLTELLEGSADKDGLNEMLAEKSAQLKTVVDSITSLESNRDSLLDEAAEYQMQAEEKMRQAQTVTGDERVALSTVGLDLTEKSNKKQIEAQEIINQLQVLQSEIEIVEPLVEKLKEDIAGVKEQIATITDSDEQAKLRSQLNDVKQQAGKMGNEIAAAIKTLSDAEEAYVEYADGIIETLAEAIESYEQVRSSTTRKIAEEKVAVCYYWKASVCSEKIGLVRHYISILENIKEAIGSGVTVDISGLISAAEQNVSEFKTSAFEDYDKSAEKYEGVSGGSEYMCFVKKRHILALYGKLILAEGIGEYDVSDQAAEKIAPLVEQVEECDPDFSRSLTAKLLDGKNDYVPMLAIDNTELYESVRLQYQANEWNKLPIDQREAAVRELLANLEAMEFEETFDREAYDSILGPEKEKLVKALEAGFDEEAYDANDPNNF